MRRGNIVWFLLHWRYNKKKFEYQLRFNEVTTMSWWSIFGTGRELCILLETWFLENMRFIHNKCRNENNEASLLKMKIKATRQLMYYAENSMQGAYGGIHTRIRTRATDSSLVLCTTR